MSAAKILVVDDEKLIRWSLREILLEQGHDVVEAADGEQALALARQDPPDLVLLDIRMPGLDGMQVMEQLLARQPDCSVVIISAHGTLDSAVDAMRRGAADYLRKPFQAEEVKLTVERLLKNVKLQRQVEHLRDRVEQSYAVEQLIGPSEAMRKMRDLVAKIAASDASNILIEGESGTGKGLVANVIHSSSARRDKPFMEVACTALQETLVESELFGHEQGAFTDAKATKRGMFELANEGTIFLDEIGDMPLPNQAKLLKALEDRQFKRVGGVRDIKVDVRVIAATNRDLAIESERGTFRKDLFFRMAVLRVRLTPLRERPADIIPLCRHFIAHFNGEFHRQVQDLDASAVRLLESYHWPGNVRELRNTIERAMILEDKNVLSADDLPRELFAQKPVASIDVHLDIPDEGIVLEDIERDLIAKALAKANGNQSKAATLLGMSRDTLRYRIKKFELDERSPHRRRGGVG